MKNHYDMLGVSPAASVDEIKHAFRREIARYHPDKVHHLGHEFQELAAERAAELTQAYGILMHESRRAAYDDTKRDNGPAHAAAGGATATATIAESRRAAAAPQPKSSGRQAETARAGAHDDFLKKAAVERFRKAAAAVFDEVETLQEKGFDVACIGRPKRGLFKKAAPVMLVGRLVGPVNAEAINETWALAARLPAEPDMLACVFLMGRSLASSRELADAISNQRRRHRNGSAPIVVPIDVRNWQALIPADAPPAVKAILERLREN